MSEYSRPPRVQEVSRQFTDTERAIDERVTGHLQTPMREAYGDAAGGYAWYAQDMKLRSAITAQLGQEQALAGAQSVRQELDRKFVQDTEDDLEAMAGINTARQLVASGQAQDLNQANEMVSRERPELLVRDKWNSYTSEAAKLQDPALREARDKQLALQSLRNSDEYSDLLLEREAKDIYGRENLVADRTKKLSATGLALSNTYEGELVRAGSLRLAKKQQEAQIKEIEAFGADPQNFAARSTIRGILDEVGIADVGDIEPVASYFAKNPNALVALNDRAWQTQHFKTPEEREDYLQSVSVLSNSSPDSPEHKAAMSKIELAAHYHSRDTAQASTYNQQMESLREVDEMLGKSFKPINDDLTDILKNTKTGITDQQKPKAMYAKLPQIIQMYEGHVPPERLAIYEEAAARLISGADGKKKPQDAYAEVLLFARSIASDLKGDVASSKTTTAANIARAKKLAEPSGEAPDPLSSPTEEDYPRVASDDDYKSLPSGTKFRDPLGEIRTKP